MADLRQRALYLADAKDNPIKQAAHAELCRRDPIYWLNTFCWTFDPRRDDPHLPFELYPFQEDFVRQLVAKIQNGEDVLTEKSRDMGISWLVLLTFQWFWQFVPGSNFHLGSRKADMVDQKGDVSSLMEKIRYNLRLQPKWLRPEGFDLKKHDNFFKIINPENGNTITGESSNENFARGGRYKAILFDEFAFWPFSDQAFASAGQSSPCRVIVSTPYGKANKFARLRFESSTDIISLHWKQHPLKDEAWYEAQKKRMTADEVAREIDINYNLSVSGVVFGEFGSTHIRKEAYKFDPFLETVVAFDFGRTMAALVAQKDKQGRLHVFKEFILDPLGAWYLKGENTNDMGSAVKAYLAGLNTKTKIHYVCDPAGNSEDHRSRTTDVKILEGQPYNFRPMEFRKAQQMKDREIEGVKLLKRILSTRISGDESLIVYEPDCMILIEAFQSGFRYKTDHAGNILEKIDTVRPYNDIMDCLRYIAIEQLSASEPIQLPKRPLLRRNAYAG